MSGLGRRAAGRLLKSIGPLLMITAALAVTACEDTGGGAAAEGRTPASRPITGEGAPAIDHAVIDRKMLDYLDQKGEFAGTYPKSNKVRDPLKGGATVAVTRGGKLVWSKAYGWADQEQSVPMEPSHRSRIGSVSKLPTAIAVLQLAEAGKLDLDAPIYGDPGPFKDINTPWPPTDRVNWPVSASVLENPAVYWAAMLDGVRELTPANFVHAEVNKVRDWASQITVRHLLSHTSGFLRSGDGDQVDAYYGREMRDYRGAHLAVLKGVVKDGDGQRQSPFVFEPGTDRKYSNHGFGLLGLIVEEASDGRKFHGYYDYTTEHVFGPLGLDDIVPNNTNLDDGLDAWPHGSKLDPDKPAKFQATGSWSASAQDVARIMCGLDQRSNHLRLLRPETVTTMQSIPFPAADGNQPHGWDSRPAGNERYKNGKIGGGASVVMKFLPGRFDAAPDDEINVAIAVNHSTVPSTSLVRDIAAAVADADMVGDYDLFAHEFRCVAEGPELKITDPNEGAKFALGTEIMFEAKAHDANGDALPITWSLPGGITKETKPGIGGGHSLFYDKLPTGKHEIVATTTDSGGHQTSAKVNVEVTYEPPEVAIISHADGDTVQADDELVLVGQSKSKFFALPDDQVTWTVIRDGSVIGNGFGHELTVPSEVMEPGDYEVRFLGHDGTSSVKTSIGITAEPKPASAPTATISKPGQASSHTVGGSLGSSAAIAFAGSAVDSEGSAISGTYFRWTADRAGEDGIETQVLCEGTHAAGEATSGGGGLTATKDCAEFTAELAGHHYAGHTNYTVKLQVWDAEGNTDTATRAVQVYTPPVS